MDKGLGFLGPLVSLKMKNYFYYTFRKQNYVKRFRKTLKNTYLPKKYL